MFERPRDEHKAKAPNDFAREPHAQVQPVASGAKLLCEAQFARSIPNESPQAVREICPDIFREILKSCREICREISKLCREICREIWKLCREICRENFARFRFKSIRPHKRKFCEAFFVFCSARFFGRENFARFCREVPGREIFGREIFGGRSEAGAYGARDFGERDFPADSAHETSGRGNVGNKSLRCSARLSVKAYHRVLSVCKAQAGVGYVWGLGESVSLVQYS